MKVKFAIVYGILIWIISTILIEIINPIFNLNFPNINIIIPIITILVTGFFSILYIRNINDNEVIEGLFVGIVFVIIDIALDFTQYPQVIHRRLSYAYTLFDNFNIIYNNIFRLFSSDEY